MTIWNMFAAGIFVSLLLITLAASQEENNHRAQPNPDLRQRYQPKRDQSRRLDHIRRLNLDEDIPSIDLFRRVTIQCSTEPLFRCSACAEALQVEQDSVIASILEDYPTGSLIASARKITNVVFMYLPLTEDDQAVDRFVASLPGVLGLYPGEVFHPHVAEVVEYIGAKDVQHKYCFTGKGVRIGILDSGIDYTHIAFGGPGTTAAFDAAFGTDIFSVENTQRDGLFPTARVVDGYDFLGDDFFDTDPSYIALPDDDPIDSQGHGTAVASAVIGVAPEVDLVAVKVCVTEGSDCPDFAVILGIEYVLDPNDDGSMDDKVDILNFSLGVSRTSGFFSIVAKAFDDIFELGVLTIIACGNEGNIPFILGEESKAAYTLAVGATGNPLTTDVKTAASYSARGPGENNSIKPEIAAPSGFAVAQAGTGTGFFRALGTSFAAPIVAGAAALLKERCPLCSPFVIKTILMNNADPAVKYFSDNDLRAPISLMGSGEVQVKKSFEADFYAYCVEDATAALSLGLIDAASDVVVRRTIRIINLSRSGNAQDLAFTFLFREQQDEDSGAVTISFASSNVTLGSDCGSTVQVEVEFRITASLAPPNGMTSGGSAADNFRQLDRQEFDGWITVSSIEKDISLPFLVLLRQAAEVTVASPLLPSFSGSPVNVPIGLLNSGAGVAQIDSYELIFISEDGPESGRGSNNPDSDFRYIGYRVLPVFETDCDYLLEFAITTWERTQRLLNSFFQISIDIDGDIRPDFTLFNTGPDLDSDIAECRLISSGGVETCTGFTVDHSTNTANTVLRVCSNDLGISQPQVINVGATTYTLPTPNSLSDGTVYRPILFPEPALVAPSYDVFPGGALENILVSGSGGVPNRTPSLGLLLFTNAYRDSSNTGAATKETEALALLRSGINDPVEVTPDVQEFPVTDDVGPDCTVKTNTPTVCPSTTEALPTFGTLVDTTTISLSRNPKRRLRYSRCPENSVPRASLATPSPSPAPMEIPTSAPSMSQRPSTLSPTMRPTMTPTKSPSQVPTTLTPTGGPTKNPILPPSQVPTTPMPQEPSTELPSLRPTDSPTVSPSTSGPSPSPSGATSGALLQTPNSLMVILSLLCFLAVFL